MTQDSQLDPARKLSSISFAVHTDPGRRREENQDSYGIIEGHLLRVYMVADGMGGARGGAIASNLAIDLVKSGLRGQQDLSSAEISSVILSVNKAIAEKGNLDPSLSGMGTTLVGIAFTATQAFVFNVGDSRLYRMGKNNFEVCTEDHTLVQELLKSGAIGPEQARNHPVSHMLTRSLGPTVELKVDCSEITTGPYAGDKLLICSDGLYNQVSSEELESHLRQYPKEEAVKHLVDLANSRGGPDNITVIIVELGDGFAEDPSSTLDTLELPNPNFDIKEAPPIHDRYKEAQAGEIKDASDRKLDNHSELAQQVAKNPSAKIFSGVFMMIVVAVLSAVAVLLLGLQNDVSVPNIETPALHTESSSSSVIVRNQEPAIAPILPEEESSSSAASLQVAGAISSVSLEVTPEASATEIIPTVVVPTVTEPTIVVPTVVPPTIVPPTSIPIVIIPTVIATNTATSTHAPIVTVTTTATIANTPTPTSTNPPTASATNTPTEIATSSPTATAVSSPTAIVEVIQPTVDSQAVIVSGEKALLIRQLEIKEKLSRLNEQLEFFSLHENQRTARLQALNDEKISLANQSSALNRQTEAVKTNIKDTKQILSGNSSREPLALAKELSQRFPKIMELYKSFEAATNDYLSAVQEKKAFPQSEKAASNLDLKLKDRSQAFNALKNSISTEVQAAIAQLEYQLVQSESEASRLKNAQIENDKQRNVFSEISAISSASELDKKKQSIQHEISKLQGELVVLSHKDS